MDLTRTYDVLIVGGGNAALCAAITARRAGASVLLLEGAPKDFRGGNSRHTRNLRCMHDHPADVLTDSYSESEYWEDLLKVTGGETNEQLARMTIRHSAHCREWMVRHGVRFQPSLGGTLHLSRTNAFFLGGGKFLVNAYYRTAEKLGVDIEYNSEVVELKIKDNTFTSAVFARKGFTHEVHAKTLIAAAGGFQSNIAWLKEAWGEAANNFIIRGTPYDKGNILRFLMDQGVKSVGDPTQCHAVAIDARAPNFDGGIVTRVDCVSLGIVVNRHALRFYDEGEDFWPKRYAIWGRLVAGQPDQIGYSIIDAKAMGTFMPPVFPPIEATSLKELAAKLNLDPDTLSQTVAKFNAAIKPGNFNHNVLDDCSTAGLTPPKSHWARPLDTPPFYAYPLRPGITFTYLGVKVNERAQIIMQDDKPSHNMFAAGEIMAGNILGKGYLAGFGMTIGTIFGRIAGEEAVKHVNA
ncbi:FAD-dependent tricarballylate dehydrogenase TcuA [Geomonas azotofigens]|uniref:FAD-dependent tricarballylate dehydrogenase TcuA n=1 Tax=Geomonas azotofigens TaxID=2843196 RepID=UPI001C11EA52|nr:FAD-dependent tricarballylate dehydrogenase TcuA [Geomonas azotofigens]MBU5615287.1 FAD-dependent tricarballylate dehydrogenase TcuA [Geomonas azotofigens]